MNPGRRPSVPLSALPALSPRYLGLVNLILQSSAPFSALYHEVSLSITTPAVDRSAVIGVRLGGQPSDTLGLAQGVPEEFSPHPFAGDLFTRLYIMTWVRVYEDMRIARDLGESSRLHIPLCTYSSRHPLVDWGCRSHNRAFISCLTILFAQLPIIFSLLSYSLDAQHPCICSSIQRSCLQASSITIAFQMKKTLLVRVSYVSFL